MKVLKALIVWINVGAEANNWKSSKNLTINVGFLHSGREGKYMSSEWQGFWIGVRRTGRETLKRIETRNISFQQQNISHAHVFPVENSCKIVSEKSNVRTLPIILYQQAWLDDRLFGDGRLLLL